METDAPSSAVTMEKLKLEAWADIEEPSLKTSHHSKHKLKRRLRQELSLWYTDDNLNPNQAQFKYSWDGSTSHMERLTK